MLETLQNAELAAFDFDNTVADTFTPSPNGIDVHKGYNIALQKMFGTPDLLKKIGGLKNRAPTEVVHDLIREEPMLQAYGVLSYKKHRSRLSALMPRGKGVQLVPFEEGEMLTLFGELLVRLKLEVLLAEIGPTWPRPCEGALEFLADLKAQGKRTAIVSSGHEIFIRRCFAVWSAPEPDVILSDDDLRPQPGPIAHKVKPSKVLIHYLLMLAHQKQIRVPWDKLVYFGDDITKDGQLAHNANIPFFWYSPKPSENDLGLKNGATHVTSWHELRSSLQ